MDAKEFTESDVRAAVEAVPGLSDGQKRSMVCVMVGHSRIILTDFGYIYCARCEDRIGDSLAGYFDGSKSVIVGHNCEQCRENSKSLTWKDTLMAPDPFAEEAA